MQPVVTAAQTRRRLRVQLFLSGGLIVLLGLLMLGLLSIRPGDANSALVILCLVVFVGVGALGLGLHAWRMARQLWSMRAVTRGVAQVQWRSAGYQPELVERVGATESLQITDAPNDPVPTRPAQQPQPVTDARPPSSEPAPVLRAAPDTALAPGQYDVVYAPETGLIVEATPSGPVDPDRLLEGLAAAFDFSQVELDQLHKGRLAPEHRRRILARGRSDVLTQSVLVLAILMGGAVAVWLTQNVVVALIGLGGVAITGLGLFISARGLRTDSSDVPQLIAGRVTRRLIRSARRPSRKEYWLHVAERRFKVHEAAYQAVVEGLSYRVFYLPGSNSVIAIEPSLDA